MQRKTVNFVGSTSASVDPFFDPQRPERRVLEELVEEELVSESDVIRALALVGVRSVQDRQLELGYAAWAATEDDEDRAWSAASAASLADRAARDDG